HYGVRPQLDQGSFHTDQDRCRLLGVRPRTRLQVKDRGWKPQALREGVGELWVVVLAGMDDRYLHAPSAQATYDRRELDEVRARAGHHHRRVPAGHSVLQSLTEALAHAAQCRPWRRQEGCVAAGTELVDAVGLGNDRGIMRDQEDRP